MKKLGILVMLACLAMLASCAEATAEQPPEMKSATIQISAFAVHLDSDESLIQDCCNRYSGSSGDALCFSIAEFPGVSKGIRYKARFVLYNGSTENTTYRLKILPMNPQNSRTGYVPAPSEAMDWISLTDTVADKTKQHEMETTLDPQEFRMFYVFLEIPKKAEPPPKWEFRVNVEHIWGMPGVFSGHNLRGVVDMRE